MKKRFTEEQIVRVLAEAEGGMPIRDVCRKHNVQEQSFYRWKKKYGGMDASEVKRLKELERENSELKQIVAEQVLDIRMLKDVNSKKVLSLPQRRRAVTYLRNTFVVSERRACKVLCLHRSTYRYPVKSMDTAHIEVVRLSERYPYWGYRKIYKLVDREQHPVGRERVRLIRRQEGLQVVRKCKKKKVLGHSTQWVHRARHPHQVWSYDFVFDQKMDGRTLKCLTVVDEFTREGLAVRVNRSLTSTDVIRVLSDLMNKHGKPQCLRSDNGPEFIAHAVQTGWVANRLEPTTLILAALGKTGIARASIPYCGPLV